MSPSLSKPAIVPSFQLLTLQNYIHIRIQQRNGRKTLTTVQGVPAEYDQKRILKALKKVPSQDGFLADNGRTSHATELLLRVRNWVRLFNFKVINEIRSLNSFQRPLA